MEKLDGKTFDIVSDNIKKLEELFPEIVTEGKVDVDKLALLFDKTRNEDTDASKDGEERYEFTWKGKKEAIRMAQKQTTGTLRPCREESVNFDETQNLYIEGDNLEVLRSLQSSYRGKVKMIYIDPPYNTGKDFVYTDDFNDNIKNYKEKMNEAYKTNTDTSGRFHTNWLNMMYPRLKLAKNLLREDGVICISIDDNEVHNLRTICDEVFGSSNFQGHIHWRRRHNQPNDKNKMIGLVAEHILVYTKDKEEYKKSGVGKIDCTGDFSNPDNDPRGEWGSKPWKTGSDQTGSRYKIVSPNGNIYDEEWMGEESTYKMLLKDNRIYFPRGGDGLPRKKYFKFEREEEGQCATNWWSHEQFGHNQGANDNLTDLFGIKNVFSNSKPCDLIRGLMQISNVKDNDIVMDFFSGSGTLAESVIEVNNEDKKNIRFILVQLPEDLEESYKCADSKAKKSLKVAIDYLKSKGKRPLLTEIGKERIRKVSKRVLENNKDKEGIEDLDIGFKVFKLDTTNIKEWDDTVQDIEEIKQMAMALDNPIKDGRSQEDVIYEILLKYGVDLTMPIEEIEIMGSKVYSVGFGYLMICLEEDINLDLIEAIGEQKPNRVVLYDNGLDNESKTNGERILKELGVKDIRTI